MSRLLHYSDTPLLAVHSVEQTDDLNSMFKPRGLWLSVEGEDDWRHWCEGEDFSLGRLKCCTEVVLEAEANVLRIPTALDLDAFTEEYIEHGEVRYLHRIRWDRVAARYQGIIIAPYQWSRRMSDHTVWYYGWDCASACIWDAAAVAELRPAPDAARAETTESK